MLNIKNLSKSFGRRKILEDFNLNLEPGKVYGLLGKNGEGKTTLMRILMGVIPPDSGEIYFKGKKLNFRESNYKKNIGFIAEDSIFYSWMTVKELFNFNASFYPKWNRNKARELLEIFSLDNNVRIKKMSRGMKLKLGLITALAAEPELLILDDPTSGLDVPTRREFIQGMLYEASAAGTTILFSTHQVHEIERIIQKLGILHKRRLILEEDYSVFKEKIRRISLVFDHPVSHDLGVKGILTSQFHGNKAELVVYPWEKSVNSRLEKLYPGSLRIENLTLEEVFISFTDQ